MCNLLQMCSPPTRRVAQVSAAEGLTPRSPNLSSFRLDARPPAPSAVACIAGAPPGAHFAATGILAAGLPMTDEVEDVCSGLFRSSGHQRQACVQVQSQGQDATHVTTRGRRIHQAPTRSGNGETLVRPRAMCSRSPCEVVRRCVQLCSCVKLREVV